jgi:hypothetical protein
MAKHGWLAGIMVLAGTAAFGQASRAQQQDFSKVEIKVTKVSFRPRRKRLCRSSRSITT